MPMPMPEPEPEALEGEALEGGGCKSEVRRPKTEAVVTQSREGMRKNGKIGISIPES